MQIDVFLDTVCPWCWVGKRRLEAALEEDGGANFQVNYRPFLLAPDMPRDGKDRAQHFAEKFGPNADLKKMSEGLMREAGDIPFHFEAISRVPNTVDSHRVIAWAGEEGNQATLVERIFEAYFANGKDIGDKDVLSEAAGKAGMDSAEVLKRLSTDDGRSEIETGAIQARGMGITGVPFYIFDRRVALSGAQPIEVFHKALEKAREEAA